MPFLPAPPCLRRWRKAATSCRACACLAAGSPPLWQVLLSHLELLDGLADDEAMDAPPTFSPAPTLPALTAGVRRARLKTAARDLWGLAGTPEVLAETTRTAEATLENALTLARAELGFTGRFAVIGLGKLGGTELGYGSDLDVLYVADAGELTPAARLAERTQRLLKEELGRSGLGTDMDARLRPHGNDGPLVLDVDSYRRYYAEAAQTWERHALVKARPVAGDAELGAGFAALAETVVYAAPFTDAQLEDVRAMKRRIETERLKSPTDLKLGPGGLLDIEWTVQLLQLRHGSRRPRLRSPNTLNALRLLRDDALITQADWETLSETYVALLTQRNHRFLQTGVSSDAPLALPDNVAALRTAAREVCLRLFYGDSLPRRNSGSRNRHSQSIPGLPGHRATRRPGCGLRAWPRRDGHPPVPAGARGWVPRLAPPCPDWP